jgi:putative copper resistance protein D
MSALELVRWALCTDLGILFGVPAAAVLVRVEATLFSMRRMLSVAAVIALPLALLGFLLAVSEMAGSGLAELDRTLLSSLVTETPFGWAFLSRMAALAVTVSVPAWPANRLRWLAVPAGAAVASLAWSGHAAASEGVLAAVRLGGDIVHLLAASMWIGALVLFLAMLASQRICEALTAAAFSRFAGTGTVLVLVLAATGIGNLLFLIGPWKWGILATLPYGRLLLTKLALFTGMLGFAGLNRFRLVPTLADGSSSTRAHASRLPLSFSIATELVLGLAVLLIVSRLGLLDPSASL